MNITNFFIKRQYHRNSETRKKHHYYISQFKNFYSIFIKLNYNLVWFPDDQRMFINKDSFVLSRKFEKLRV